MRRARAESVSRDGVDGQSARGMPRANRQRWCGSRSHPCQPAQQSSACVGRSAATASRSCGDGGDKRTRSSASEAVAPSAECTSQRQGGGEGKRTIKMAHARRRCGRRRWESTSSKPLRGRDHEFESNTNARRRPRELSVGLDAWTLVPPNNTHYVAYCTFSSNV